MPTVSICPVMVTQKSLDPRVELVLLERCEDLIEGIVKKVKFMYDMEGNLVAGLYTNAGFKFEFYLDEGKTVRKGVSKNAS